MRAASTRSPGIIRSPARSVRKTIAACWIPRSSAIPQAEWSGCGLPRGGAMPSVLSRTDEGPVICIQARAVICGGIIIGIIRQNTSAALARISVSATTKAKAAPMTMEINVPAPAVISECQSAVRVAGRVSTSVAWSSVNPPPRPNPSASRRSIGPSAIPATGNSNSEISRSGDRLIEGRGRAVIGRRRPARSGPCSLPHRPGPWRDQTPSA